MNRYSPGLRQIAERLVAHEAAGNTSLGINIPAACLASERLRPHLAALMGNIGFRALLSRSLALGAEDVPWLSAVRVKSDGAFEGFEDLGAKVEAGEFSRGCAVLLAHLLGLLVAFIGEDLTLHLVGEAWPEHSFHKPDFGEGGK